MPRSEVMNHMTKKNNVGVLFVRQVKTGEKWQHCFICNTVMESCAISNRTSEIGYIAPLYITKIGSQQDLFSTVDSQNREINLNSDLMATLGDAYEFNPSPENILNYIYSILNSPFFQDRFVDFLKIDFPRIPFTENKEIFNSLANLGYRLTALHLLDSPELSSPIAQFDGAGDNKVERGRSQGLHYDPDQQRVYINQIQYFAPIPPEVWEYQIGGYQVCEKWLKDRYDRRLSLDEIQTYCRIVTALARTIEIQEEIDKLYPLVEENLLDIQL